MNETADLIQTERLLLRRVRPTDEQAALELHTDPEASRFRPGGTSSPDNVRQDLVYWIGQWYRDGIGYWAVELAETGEIVGFGGVMHHEVEGEQVLNLYYRFRPSTWGRGYAAEMATAAVDWASRHRPDRPVVIITRPENVPSQRVAEKLGFRRYLERDTHGFLEWLYRLPVTT